MTFTVSPVVARASDPCGLIESCGREPARAGSSQPFSATEGDSSPGCGRLAFSLVDGATTLVHASARSPLRVLVPRHRGRSAWAFLATHGGGLVAGDEVELTVDVGPGAIAMIGTQSETKVYRSPTGLECVQVLRARVAKGGVLVVLPEPTSPFAGSRYRQEQHFEVAEGASLLYLDSLVAGRTARGERWAFSDYSSRTEVVAAGHLILGDALVLGPRALPSVAERLGRFSALAVASLMGPAFAGGARTLLDGLGRAPALAGAPVLATVSPLAGGVLLRAAASSAEHLARYMREALSSVAEVLGEDPFELRW